MTDKKYPIVVWTRQPVRKFRMRPDTKQSIEILLKGMTQGATEIQGATKAGGYIIVPISNVAYIEVEGLGEDLNEES